MKTREVDDAGDATGVVRGVGRQGHDAVKGRRDPGIVAVGSVDVSLLVEAVRKEVVPPEKVTADAASQKLPMIAPGRDRRKADLAGRRRVISEDRLEVVGAAGAGDAPVGGSREPLKKRVVEPGQKGDAVLRGVGEHLFFLSFLNHPDEEGAVVALDQSDAEVEAAQAAVEGGREVVAPRLACDIRLLAVRGDKRDLLVRFERHGTAIVKSQ
jgi:hypothetical protein